VGTFTINTTAPQDARIVDAFGKYLNLGRDANAGEVKAKLIDMLKQVVFDQERKTLQDAIAVSDLDPT